MTSNSRFKIGRAGATLRSSLGSQLCRLSVWGKWDIGLSSRRQNNATWIDVLESETAVARVRPTNRLHRCGHVHKSVEFAHKKGGSYWLEVSGSESPVISLIITTERD
jgi:hypothetical protein